MAGPGDWSGAWCRAADRGRPAGRFRVARFRVVRCWVVRCWVVRCWVVRCWVGGWRPGRQAWAAAVPSGFRGDAPAGAGVAGRGGQEVAGVVAVHQAEPASLAGNLGLADLGGPGDGDADQGGQAQPRRGTRAGRRGGARIAWAAGSRARTARAVSRTVRTLGPSRSVPGKSSSHGYWSRALSGSGAGSAGSAGSAETGSAVTVRALAGAPWRDVGVVAAAGYYHVALADGGPVVRSRGRQEPVQ